MQNSGKHGTFDEMSSPSLQRSTPLEMQETEIPPPRKTTSDSRRAEQRLPSQSTLEGCQACLALTAVCMSANCALGGASSGARLDMVSASSCLFKKPWAKPATFGTARLKIRRWRLFGPRHHTSASWRIAHPTMRKTASHAQNRPLRTGARSTTSVANGKLGFLPDPSSRAWQNH